jgi:LmbE family N-acetylglucosaminyl deacetylase
MRLALIAILLCSSLPSYAASYRPLDVGRGERLLVIAPHPDDETIAAAGLIQRVRAQGGEVRIVLVTAGDGFIEAVAKETGSPQPRPSAFVAYGELRLRETRAVVRALAPDHVRLEVLGFPDGGLDGLLEAHWWRSRPERSRFTGATDPPYDDQALEPDVPYDGDDLRRELVRIIAESRPTIVVLPDPFDRHPDHRATGLFTLLAVRDWANERPKHDWPQLLAYLVHWPDWPPGWDTAQPLCRPDQGLDLPKNLKRPGRRVALALTADEAATKQAAMQRYVTQQEAMGSMLAGFVRCTEPFTELDVKETERVADAIEKGIGKEPHQR